MLVYMHPEEIATVSACCVQLTAGNGRQQSLPPEWLIHGKLEDTVVAADSVTAFSSAVGRVLQVVKWLPPTRR